MKYKDRVSSLIANVQNRIISAKNAVENNTIHKDDLIKHFDALTRELGFIEDLVDLEDRDM